MIPHRFPVLVCVQEGQEPPKHATAFLDAAFRLLAASPASGCADGALEAACGSLCDAVVVFGSGGGGVNAEGAPDCRACVRASLCRVAKTQGVRGARAALLAAAERLRDVTERCAEAARAAASAPPGATYAAATPAAPGASPMEVAPAVISDEEAHRQYENVRRSSRVVLSISTVYARSCNVH
jgi:hypothetical protein